MRNHFSFYPQTVFALECVRFSDFEVSSDQIDLYHCKEPNKKQTENTFPNDKLTPPQSSD